MFKIKFMKPRIWSNNELKKFAPLFSGDIVNVSAWRDEDKQGRKYRDYFVNANSYTITNWKGEKGFQGKKNEILLNLEGNLPKNLIGKFDVVFNHTTLEWIYDVRKAFKNLCLLSRDIVIIVVPFYAEITKHPNDYWRFTPQSIGKLFEENGYKLLYLNINKNYFTYKYIFAIGTKKPERWRDYFIEK